MSVKVEEKKYLVVNAISLNLSDRAWKDLSSCMNWAKDVLVPLGTSYRGSYKEILEWVQEGDDWDGHSEGYCTVVKHLVEELGYEEDEDTIIKGFDGVLIDTSW